MDQKLLKAAREGKIEVFRNLPDSENNKLYATTEQGNTVLHQAAKFGHVDVVKEIIKRNAFLVVQPNLKGETPAHVAARAGHTEVILFLINHVKVLRSVSVASTRDNSGCTPIHAAVRNNKLSVVRELSREDHTALTVENDIGESPLSIAIDQRWSSLATEIINRNKDTLKFSGPNGHTPLHLAVLRSDSAVMKKILMEIDPKLTKEQDENLQLTKKQDENKRTPLHYAAALGDQKAVKLLLETGSSAAYVSDLNRQAPIHLAAENGKETVLKVLLEPCPDTIELLDNRQQNILHIAAKHGNLEVVAYIMSLQEMEELVNSPDVDGNTPLHLAAASFHSSVVYKLSRNPKVEIRALNKAGRSALTLVQSADDDGMELQQHLTLKALKSAYAKRGVNTDETVSHEIGLGSANANPVPKKPFHRGSKKTKEMARTLSLMATLIATFTFTAAFTIPGGFKNDGPEEGMATLVGKLAFQAFVITDTVAMTSSITAAVIIFWSSSYRDKESFMDALPIAICLTWLSLVAMALAFVTGLFTVLSQRLWLAITVCAIGCAAPAGLYVVAPLVIIALERRSPSVVSSSNRYNIVENNPFMFVVRLIRMRW